MTADAAREVLTRVRLADLVTIDPETLSPVATPLPLLYDPGLGEYGTFTGHVSRTNPQWRHEPYPALVLVRGGDAYVTPDWYPNYSAGGAEVPTWDYEVVQATGALTAHEDPAWLERHVRELAARYDPAYELDRGERRLLDGQLRAIVGVEICVSSVVGKSKLSQNRSVAEIHGVADGLDAQGRADLADRIRSVALPHAEAREARVAAARDRRG